MKKIFLFLSAVLVSLAMQATIVTEEKELTSFAPYENQGSYNSETKVFSDIIDWGAGQIWYGNDDPLDADGYAFLGLDLASAADNLVSVTVDYTDASGLASQKMYIKAGSTSNLLPLDGRYIKKIEVKNYSNVAEATIALSKLYLANIIGEYHATEVWTGSENLDWDWNNRLIISKENVANLHVGDMIEISYVGDETTEHKFEVYHEWGNGYPAFAAGQVYIGGANAIGSIRFAIMEESDLTTMQNEDGFYLKGEHITITKVSTICNNVLWTGSKAFDDSWSANEPIAASAFADVTVGDVLNLRLSAAPQYAQVQLLNGEWGEFRPHLWYTYNEAPAEEPTVLSFILNQSTVDDLKAKGLLIRGANYTVTDVYVTAAEATTVSYDLTVTAGMATLVLPFNVPDLPAGVQAYELTNDGSNTITATEVDEIQADKPVLIVADASGSPYTFFSELGGDATISGRNWWNTETYNNGSLFGNYRPTHTLDQKTGDNFNYVLQDGVDGVAFYQVKDDGCTIDSYRAYLSCGYPGNTVVSAPMRIVFHKDSPTGIENANAKAKTEKILRNGQIQIIRDNKMFNVLGQQL